MHTTPLDASPTLDVRKSSDHFHEGQSGEASSDVFGSARDSSRNEKPVDEFRETASDQRNESVKASLSCGEKSRVEFKVDCIEVQGDGHKLAVSDKKVSKKRVASKKSAMSDQASMQTSLGEDNLKSFLALLPNEKQRTLLLKRHPEFGGPQPPPFLIESVRLFRECGMDSRVLMQVIGKLKKRQKVNIFLNTPHKPEQVVTFLRDKIGVRNLGKVVLKSYPLLTLSLATLTEHDRELGVTRVCGRW